MTDVNPLQFRKASPPIEVTEFPNIKVFIFVFESEKNDIFANLLLSMFKVSMLLHHSKASPPIEVTELGIFIDVKPLQPMKARSPIEVTELGMVTDVKPLQPEKAQLPIEVTELGIVTDVNPLQL